MIREIEGDIFHSKQSALVIPVNCAGAMGAGLALLAKQAFPEIFAVYRRALKANQLRIGLPYWMQALQTPQKLVLFPTKQHWRESSQMSFIDEGLSQLRNQLVRFRTPGIAMPLLGAGLGMLKPGAVVTLIYERLRDLTEVDIELYHLPPVS